MLLPKAGFLVLSLALLGAIVEGIVIDPQVFPAGPVISNNVQKQQQQQQEQQQQRQARLLHPAASKETTQQNGSVKHLKSALTEVVDLTLDSGWFKFFFGAAGNPTAYTFRFNYSDYVQISITDAYCTGDSFDLFRNGEYLVTTPRVPSDRCHTWDSDPDVTFWNPRWSSTKFMLPGIFNLTIATKDSPFAGGAAFIRADRRVEICSQAVAPFILVNEPRLGHDQAENVCARVGAIPAHITPANAAAASQTLTNCIGRGALAWFGRLSLVQTKTHMHRLGCLAFSNAIPEDPTVEVVDCDSGLPVLCMLA